MQAIKVETVGISYIKFIFSPCERKDLSSLSFHQKSFTIHCAVS